MAGSIPRTVHGSSRTEAGTLDSTIKVAVVRGDRRRGAVAEAFALIGDDVRRQVEADSETRDRPQSRQSGPSLDLHSPRHAVGRRRRDPGRGGILDHDRWGNEAGGDAELAISSTGWATVVSSGADLPPSSISIPVPGRGPPSNGSVLVASRSHCSFARAWPLPAAASRSESPRHMASTGWGWGSRISRGFSFPMTAVRRG